MLMRTTSRDPINLEGFDEEERAHIFALVPNPIRSWDVYHAVLDNYYVNRFIEWNTDGRMPPWTEWHDFEGGARPDLVGYSCDPLHSIKLGGRHNLYCMPKTHHWFTIALGFQKKGAIVMYDFIRRHLSSQYIRNRHHNGPNVFCIRWIEYFDPPRHVEAQPGPGGPTSGFPAVVMTVIGRVALKWQMRPAAAQELAVDFYTFSTQAWVVLEPLYDTSNEHQDHVDMILGTNDAGPRLMDAVVDERNRLQAIKFDVTANGRNFVPVDFTTAFARPMDEFHVEGESNDDDDDDDDDDDEDSDEDKAPGNDDDEHSEYQPRESSMETSEED